MRDELLQKAILYSLFAPNGKIVNYMPLIAF